MDWVETDGLRLLRAEMPGATAYFTTRIGGISRGVWAGLNLGLATGDEPEAVSENRTRLVSGLGISAADVLCARQVHGAEVEVHEHRLDEAPFARDKLPSEPGPGADGQVTSSRRVNPLVMVADCLPVALHGPGPDGTGERVAMLHCGWRPLAAGIIERGVRLTGATSAAIGPGIGPCCYEVGAEVMQRFAGLFPSGSAPAEEACLDLPEVATRLLLQAGVDQIDRADLCTSCSPDLFFSHRRDRGSTGRQAGIVGLGRWGADA